MWVNTKLNHTFLTLKLFYMWKKKKVCLGTINEEAKQLLVKVSYHVNCFHIIKNQYIIKTHKRRG